MIDSLHSVMQVTHASWNRECGSCNHATELRPVFFPSHEVCFCKVAQSEDAMDGAERGGRKSSQIMPLSKGCSGPHCVVCFPHHLVALLSFSDPRIRLGIFQRFSGGWLLRYVFLAQDLLHPSHTMAQPTMRSETSIDRIKLFYGHSR